MKVHRLDASYYYVDFDLAKRTMVQVMMMTTTMMLMKMTVPCCCVMKLWTYGQNSSQKRKTIK